MSVPIFAISRGTNPEDFIEEFLEMTSGSMSPEIFRQWSAIALVAGACERRIWAQVGDRQAFPNLYIFLVAPPGVGKYIIEDIHSLWTETLEPGTKSPAFHVAPTSTTKASLVDELAKRGTVRLAHAGPPIEYHSLLVAAEEIGVLLPSYDTEYISVLNKVYNNPPVHEETRRTGSVREVIIPFPQLNIIAGVQPGWLASSFPEEAWSTGLTARLIMIYAPESAHQDMFATTPDIEFKRLQVLRRMGQISSLYGELPWQPEAKERLRLWNMTGGPPRPTHSKLEHYSRRRGLHALKLSIVSTVARSARTILLSDVDRAIEWLCEAEALMPDIFRSMIGKSDHQVIEELYHYILGLFQMHKGKPIPEQKIWAFLQQRVPSDKIPRIIEVAERSGTIERLAGESAYKPKAKEGGFVE